MSTVITSIDHRSPAERAGVRTGERLPDLPWREVGEGDIVAHEEAEPGIVILEVEGIPAPGGHLVHEAEQTVVGTWSGESLEAMRRFGQAGIVMNGQIVLCPGYNDGDQLQRTMEDMAAWGFSSCSIVPVGLTKFREWG